MLAKTTTGITVKYELAALPAGMKFVYLKEGLYVVDPAYESEFLQSLV